MCRRLFDHYDRGAKGYLDEHEAKRFLLDALNVSELAMELDDVNATVDLLWKEMDHAGQGQVKFNELIKPSWGNIQSVLDSVYTKMNHLAPLPDLSQKSKLQQGMTTDSSSTMASNNSTSSGTTTKMYPPSLRGSDDFVRYLKDSMLVSVQQLEDVCPYAFICPITQELMTDPVLLLESGQTYERSAIQEWLATHNHDPLTLSPITSKTIVPILSLKQAIEEWTDKEKENHKKRKLQERQKRLEQEKSGEKEKDETKEESGKDDETKESEKDETKKSEIDKRESDGKSEQDSENIEKPRNPKIEAEYELYDEASFECADNADEDQVRETGDVED